MPTPVTGGYPDAQSDRYDFYTSTHSYSYESGNLVLPVMGPDGTPPHVVKVHAAFGGRTSVSKSRKRGNPPIFPALGVDTPSGDTFLSGNLAFATMPSGSNASQLDYAVESHNEYVQGVQPGTMNAVRGEGDVFQTGRIPFETDSLNAAIIIGELIGGNILEDQTPNAPDNIPTGIWLDPLSTGPVGAEFSNLNVQNVNRLYYDSAFSAALQSTNLIL